MSRYIDADETKRMLREFCIDGDEDAEYWFDFMGIEDCIDNTVETADVRENVRGEWLPMKRLGGEKGQTPDVMCSVCHAPALWLGTLGCIRSNYCPNCGADMRGDNHD